MTDHMMHADVAVVVWEAALGRSRSIYTVGCMCMCIMGAGHIRALEGV